LKEVEVVHLRIFVARGYDHNSLSSEVGFCFFRKVLEDPTAENFFHRCRKHSFTDLRQHLSPARVLRKAHVFFKVYHFVDCAIGCMSCSSQSVKHALFAVN
jgi:hypothetical protein